MGTPTTPRDAAPAYEELFHNHPVNQQPPSGPSTAYAALPQTDDYELQHQHQSDPDIPANPSDTLLQTLGTRFHVKPHVHCEACDLQHERREKRRNERHCCLLVAATFMVAFMCLLLLGVVITQVVGKKEKRG